MSSISVSVVSSRRDWDEFHELPWTIFRDCAHWVGPLRLQARELLDERKNPFFRHARMLPLIARREGRPVGRVVGLIDDAHNEHRGEKAAFFGFFECLNDPPAAEMLLSRVRQWAAGKGMSELRGPASPSLNHECGILVEGFEDSPAVMMPYHFPYYGDLLESAGLTKAVDMYAYTYRRDVSFEPAIFEHVEKLKARKGASIRFRDLDLARFDAELEVILGIHNDSMDHHWGFSPMTLDELRHMGRDMKPFVDPRLLFIVEIDGTPAAYALGFPDVNQGLRKLRSGRLLPFGWLRLLWDLKGPGRARTLTRCRFLTVGVRKSYQHLGLGPLFYSEFLKRCMDAGYLEGEASWVMEDNLPINKAHRRMGGKRTKTYRLYSGPTEGRPHA
jgi:hypothetical protein